LSAEEQLLVGKINAAYGIKGWVKVYSYTDPIEQILTYAPWYLGQGGSKQVQFGFDQAKKHNKGIIVLPSGFKDRNQAEALIGNTIWVDRAQLPELAEGEFFWHQLEGLQVWNEAGELLGQVSHLFETGASDVLVVEASSASVDDRERLIPYVEGETVLRVDLEAGRLLVAWLIDY